MTSYMEIAVNVPQVSGVFHYHLPAELEGQVKPGHLVEVPFGRVRVQGVVLGSVDEPAVADTRPVISVIDRQAVLTAAQIALAQYLSESNLAPLAAFIDLMLPPGLGQQADTLYSIDRSRPAAHLSDTQRRLLAVLDKRGGSLTGRQIDRALPRLDWRSSARSLVRQGVLTSRPVLPAPSARPKHVRTAMLACSPEEARAALPNLGKTGSLALGRRQTVIECLLREPGPVDVSWIYAESGASLPDLHRLADLGFVNPGRKPGMAGPLAGRLSHSYRTA